MLDTLAPFIKSIGPLLGRRGVARVGLTESVVK